MIFNIVIHNVKPAIPQAKKYMKIPLGIILFSLFGYRSLVMGGVANAMFLEILAVRKPNIHFENHLISVRVKEACSDLST